MVLKAVFLDFRGIIINDESIHQELVADILLEENLRPDNYDFQRFCLGKSDRSCLKNVLECRGRIVSQEYLTKLINRKSQNYQQKLSQLDSLPLYSGLSEFLNSLQQQQLIIGLVTGALKQEAQFVLDKAGIADYFSLIVSEDDSVVGRPEPDSYLLAVTKINQQNPDLDLKTSQCLVIEDTYAGIEAGKKAKMQVVGISHTHPLHMLQRRANWTVDYFADIEIERVNQTVSQN